jgi:hypothetical protein
LLEELELKELLDKAALEVMLEDTSEEVLDELEGLEIVAFGKDGAALVITVKKRGANIKSISMKVLRNKNCNDGMCNT